MLVCIPCVALSLLGWVPLDSDPTGYLPGMLLLVIAAEVWLLALDTRTTTGGRASVAHTAHSGCVRAGRRHT